MVPSTLTCEPDNEYCLNEMQSNLFTNNLEILCKAIVRLAY